MLNLLQSATDQLELVLTAAGDVDAHVSFVDTDATVTSASDMVPGKQNLNSTTASTFQLCSSPASGKVRNVKFISVRNVHATVSNTATVQYTSSSPSGTFELFKCTLLAGEQLVCREGTWFHFDALGAVYSTGGVLVDPARNDFRLSGVTATPVMTADSTSLSTIFLCQYKGNHLSLFDGTNWQDCAPAAEVSLAVTGRTTDLPFDIFAFLNAGVVTLEFTNWTNATTRATALVRLDGVLVKSGDSTRRYLGSCRPRSATAFHFVRNGDDLPCKFDLWNVTNRVEFPFVLRSLTNTWAYTLATWRQAQGSVNYQVDVMVGLQEENFLADLLVTSTNASTTVSRQVGIGFDSTTAFIGAVGSVSNPAAVASECLAHATVSHQPTIGRHFYSWLEISTATGTTTWLGDNGALRVQSGMTGSWNC
jgi:hypothetical protein